MPLPSAPKPIPKAVRPLPTSCCTRLPSLVFQRKVSLLSPPVVAASRPLGEIVPCMTVFLCPEKLTTILPVATSSIAEPNSFSLPAPQPTPVNTNRWLSGVKASAVTWFFRPVTFFCNAPLESYRQIVASIWPTATVLPSGLHASEMHEESCPFSSARSCPVAADQRRPDLSGETVAT